MTRYEEFTRRAQNKHGDKFDVSALSEKFIRYFNSGERIKVKFYGEEEITGTVSVTTGWKPSFMLMRRSSDHGSSWLLNDKCEIVAVKRGRVYA